MSPSDSYLYVIYLPKPRKIKSEHFSEIIALLWTTKADKHFIVRYYFKVRSLREEKFVQNKIVQMASGN